MVTICNNIHSEKPKQVSSQNFDEGENPNLAIDMNQCLTESLKEAIFTTLSCQSEQKINEQISNRDTG